MAATVTRARHNIRGAAGGVANGVVYFGPTAPLDGHPQINSSNTLKVWRWNESTGAAEQWAPGGGDFSQIDRGSLAGGVGTGQGLGRAYVIIAKADFTLDHVSGGAG